MTSPDSYGEDPLPAPRRHSITAADLEVLRRLGIIEGRLDRAVESELLAEVDPEVYERMQSLREAIAWEREQRERVAVEDVIAYREEHAEPRSPDEPGTWFGR